MIVLYLVASVIFLLIYICIYRPLFSHADPGGIGDVIAITQNLRLQELERLVSTEMTYLISRELSAKRQKKASRERCRAISDRLVPVEADVRLYLAFTRRKAMEIRRKDPAMYTDREWLLQEVFEKAQSCCLVLTFAKASRMFMPWDVQRFLEFHRETVMQETRELMVLFLKLSETYGDHHRENLLAALDAWDLAEENI
jgi:hypothetical protein